MSESSKSSAYNALTSRWLPVVQATAGSAAGTTVWASPVEVLCGEVDGVDLDWPRDDFRVYARLLLSALVQALFPPKDKAELERRLATPMTRVEVEARIAELVGDFELFSPVPLFQVLPPSVVKEGGAAPFVFQSGDLAKPPDDVDAIGLPTALVTLFVEQTYAGGAGRGYGAGPGGQPGVMTLVDPGSIRMGAWANVLASDWAARRYAPDGPRPWSNEKRSDRARAATGLVEGLFFQPRAIWLIPCESGRCSFTGLEGPRVRLSPFFAKSSLAKKPAKGEDIWQHPCSPMATNSIGIGVVRLNAAQPAWTGFAQLLSPVSKRAAKVKHVLEGPAPVLDQWKALRGRPKRPRLLVLDFERDKANVKQRFFESWPLTDDLLQKPEVVEELREHVADAEAIQRSLDRALLAAHDDRAKGGRPGLASADAERAFWMQTEAPFLGWLTAATREDGVDTQPPAASHPDATRMRESLRRIAVRIFDDHCALSEFDPRKQALVARARRRLRYALWPPSEAAAHTVNVQSALRS
jgi:CRISPR type I-E-associated protein CasA/Cse1